MNADKKKHASAACTANHSFSGLTNPLNQANRFSGSGGAQAFIAGGER